MFEPKLQPLEAAIRSLSPFYIQTGSISTPYNDGGRRISQRLKRLYLFFEYIGCDLWHQVKFSYKFNDFVEFQSGSIQIHLVKSESFYQTSTSHMPISLS